ncbi:hypothetical protein MBLNU457_7537t1 [Dothideomycetes sp. NU457]
MVAKSTNASTPTVSRTQSVRKTGTKTPVSSRAAVKTPMSSQATNAHNGQDAEAGASVDDEDDRAQTALIIEELQTRLQNAELAAEESDKQNTVLQTRLDQQLHEHTKLEEQLQELHERLEESENDKKETTRQKRELENIYEADRRANLKAREEAQFTEDELRATIERLKESVVQKDSRAGLDEEDRRPTSFRSSASPHLDAGHFAPSSSIQRSDSRSSSRLVLQKDKLIESLRLELAEVQIKMVELENVGGGRMQELEATLMEAKMTNARLMEDNESFQLLLSEKTLSGDLTSSDFLRSTEKQTSLADELGSVPESEDENYKKFQSEISSLKDQNKALTTYINTIISRLMEHSEFEAVLHNNPSFMTGGAPPAPAKDMPPPPPEKDDTRPVGFLTRTKSILGARPSRPRPQSVFMTKSDSQIPTAHEDPSTAPRIPITSRTSQRSISGSHQRATSEWTSAADVNALRPSITSPRNSFSLSSSRPTTSRMPSGTSIPTISESEKSVHRANRDSKISSGRNSVGSDNSNPSSPPRSTISGAEKSSSSVMMGSKPRPLRLVQNAAEDEAAKKAANRASWYGWFNKANDKPAV